MPLSTAPGLSANESMLASRASGHTPVQPSEQDSGQLDPQAINLAKAIRQTESGGDFKAKGKSGEYGAYQYTEPTWAKDSALAGVNVPLKEATPAQQNEVAYKKLKSLKDEGYNVGEIASIWNSGDAQAYKGKFSSGKPATGTNSYGVRYDVPAYARSVATAYQTLKQGGQVQADPENPSSTAAPQSAPPEGLGDKILRGAENISDVVAPGVRETLGTNIAQMANSIEQGPTTQQKVNRGNLIGETSLGENIGAGAQLGLLTAGMATPAAESAVNAAGPISRIGYNAALGAGLGTAQGLTNNDSGGEIAKKAGVGAATAGLLSTAGEAVSGIAQWLPKRLASSFLSGTSPETVDYAMNKGLGTPSQMLKQSNASLGELESSLTEALKAKGQSYVQADGAELFDSVAHTFPDANMSAQDVVDNVKKLVPLKTGLVDKVTSNRASLNDLRNLNSALGKATFKSRFDEPTVKAGKEIGSAVYHALSDQMKKAVPESAAIFDDYSKEIQLNGALTQLLRKGDKAKFITLQDIAAILAGFQVGGPVGAAGGYVLDKLGTSPEVNLKAAGLLHNLASPAAKSLGQAALPPLASGIGGLLRPSNKPPK